jgi:diadenosine tetraphosphate (Ap4A) HIT family hydrolase
MKDRPCPFCSPSGVFLENDLAFAIPDKYPIRPGHILVVSRRHVASYFDLTREERAACWDLVAAVRDRLMEELAPGGFKIGINDGRAAGQSIMHVHIHIVPMGGRAPDSRTELLTRDDA